MKAGWLTCMPVVLLIAGQISGGALAAAIGNQRLQCMFVLTVGGALLAGEAIKFSISLQLESF